MLRRSLSSSTSLAYRRLRANGVLRYDAAQEQVLETYLSSEAMTKGVYLYGPVGSGKSMLMDLFFANATAIKQKRRVHFHTFMLEVHERIYNWKQQFESSSHNLDLRPERDAIAHVANELAKECRLLCFDEFQITDIADALIMRKLFGVLFQRQTVIVATSNTAPHQLYQDGVNREYFLPFIDELLRHCDAVPMIESTTDHRLLYPKRMDQYLTPLNASNQLKFENLAAGLEPDIVPRVKTIQVMMGRSLTCRWAKNHTVWFTFEELCATEKGAADYTAICERFETVLVSNVPILTRDRHNEARRFITLIDELYEHKTRFICTAAASPEHLFLVSPVTSDNTTLDNHHLSSRWNDGPTTGAPQDPVSDSSYVVSFGELCSVKELGYAFRRAASRLHEMQSQEYIDRARGGD